MKETKTRSDRLVWHRSCVTASHFYIRGWIAALKGFGDSTIDFQALDVFDPTL